MRITCKQPANEEVMANVSPLGVNWATLIEAPDFSLPDAADKFADRDPADATRALRPGQAYVSRSLLVYNDSSSDDPITLEVRVLRESGDSFVAAKLGVGGGDTAELQLGGAGLFKRDFSAANGDRLQVRASLGGNLSVTAWYQTRVASDHIGVIA